MSVCGSFSLVLAILAARLLFQFKNEARTSPSPLGTTPVLEILGTCRTREFPESGLILIYKNGHGVIDTS